MNIKTMLLLVGIQMACWCTEAEQIFFEQDFSKGGIPSIDLISIESENHPEFKQSMELRSRVQSGQKRVDQGKWNFSVENLPENTPVVLDYYFQPLAGDSRYAISVNSKDKKEKQITILYDQGNLIASNGKKWQKTAEIGQGQWCRLKYFIDPSTGTYDLYVNDMKLPAASNLKFRTEKPGQIGYFFTLGSENNESKSRYANIVLRSPEKKRVIYHEDYKEFKTLDRQKIVDISNQDFNKAIELTSEKNETKTLQSRVKFPLLNIGNASKVIIDYYFNPMTASARYALLVSDLKNKPILTLLQEGGKLRVSYQTRWEKIQTPIALNEFTRIKYEIDTIKNTVALYVKDMDTPVLKNIPYRNAEAETPGLLWSIGSETEASQTQFGPITVTVETSDVFPPDALSEAPFFTIPVRWIAEKPQFSDFATCAPVPLFPANGTRKEAGMMKFLRDEKNLYVLVDFEAPGMTKREIPSFARDSRIWSSDCFELFLQPDITRNCYMHIVGNASNAIYDAMHDNFQKNIAWNSNVTTEMSASENGWGGIVTIPFADLGGAPAANTVWGFNAGRENSFANEVSSWMRLEQFHAFQDYGRLLFPARAYKGSIAAESKELYNKLFDFDKKLKSAQDNIQKSESAALAQRASKITEQKKHLEMLQKKYQESSHFNEYRNFYIELDEFLAETEVMKKETGKLQLLFAPSSIATKRKYAAIVESSMNKVFQNYSGSEETEAKLRISGNEYGSFQIVLMTVPGMSINSVKIAIDAQSPLQVTSFLVQEIHSAVPQKPSIPYPDLLLGGNEFTIAPQTVVPLFFDVFLPAGTPPGVYEAEITISPDSLEPVKIPLQVTATGLNLPQSASLDTAFCFMNDWVEEFYGMPTPQEKQLQYCKFLIDHRLEPMNLWSKSIDIGENNLDFCAENGKTMLFLPVTDQIRQNEEHYRKLIQKYSGKLRPIFFGYDEILMLNNPSALANMKRDFGIAKELFPEIPRLNTATIDERLFGLVDIWCPLFDHLDNNDAKMRMQKGEKVWWYPTDYPPAPFANLNLNSPGIDPRIIPLMTWKLNLSGLLYWAVNREWLTNAPREGKIAPFEDFAKRSIIWMTPEIKEKLAKGEIRWPQIPWMPYFRSVSNPKIASRSNGGGNLMYPGENWEPLPSIRLKNLRDGMQDYEYLVMLKNNVAQLEKQNPQNPVLIKARQLLAIPANIVKSAIEYTKSAEDFINFRNSLIDTVLETQKALK